MKTECDDKKKISLTGVPETMLQTVFARAQETKKPNGKILETLVSGFSLVEEHSLAEGMADILPVYRLLGKISFIRNLSNKIIVLEARP